MVYTIYWTEHFHEMYEDLDTSEKNWIAHIEKQLQIYPYGKILRYSWFREKKYLDKRLYFIVDENMKRILFVDFRSKKEQERVIAKILSSMEVYLRYLRNL